MANKNKNINALVDDDDDPTSELETLKLDQPIELGTSPAAGDLEADAHTYDVDDAADDAERSLDELRSDLRARSETIERLQFDIEKLHARWLGLETEIKAREQQTTQLSAELKKAEQTVARRDKMLERRDEKIKALQAEIRERDRAYRDLRGDADALEQRAAELQAELDNHSVHEELDENRGRLSAQQAELRTLRAQLKRTEQYADEIRRRFADYADDADAALTERSGLQQSLEQTAARAALLENELEEAREQLSAYEQALADAERNHEQELRTLRFELGEAQETVAQSNEISEQLAADLVDTRGFRDQLEKMLVDAEENSQSRIEQLEKDVRKLQKLADERAEKLEAKSEAINCLLAELAKKTQEMDSIGEMEHVIQEIDGRMSERFDERAPLERDRVSRVLIGRIDKQEVRFPLFKSRLTIGRTAQNDIQLKAHYISRRHAVVVSEGDTTRVIDWGSKNGVLVNGSRVTEHFLRHGDVITIGTAEFRYEERPKRDA